MTGAQGTPAEGTATGIGAVDELLRGPRLDPAEFRKRSIECYRHALTAAEDGEADTWIHSGAWFERLSLELSDPAIASTFDVAEAARSFRNPPPLAESVPADERRRHRRVGLRDGCFVSLDGHVHITRTYDMSRGGARLQPPDGVPPPAIGAPARLTVPGVCFDRPCQVVGVGEALRLSFV